MVTEDLEREELRKKILDKGKTDLKDDDLTVFKRPSKGCKHCYGEGREGWDSSTGEVIVCRCTKRGLVLGSAKEGLLTVGELTAILRVPKPDYIASHIEPKSIRRAERKAFKSYKKNRNG